MIEMVEHEAEDGTAAAARVSRAGGSVYGPAADRLKKVARGLNVSTRDLVQAILEYADPAPAIDAILRRQVESLRNKAQATLLSLEDKPSIENTVRPRISETSRPQQ